MTAPDAMVHRARQKVPTLEHCQTVTFKAHATQQKQICAAARSRAGRGPRWEGLLPCLLQGIDHIPRLVFGRRDNGQSVRILELVDTIPFDSTKLRLEYPGLCPFAILPKRHITDNGFERGLAQIISKLFIINALGRCYGLSD